MLIFEHLPVPHASLAAVLVDAVTPSVVMEGEEELEAEAFEKVGGLHCGSREKGRCVRRLNLWLRGALR